MPRRLRLSTELPLLASGLILLVSCTAHAQAGTSTDAQPAALSWVRGQGARECASARELAAAVEEQLGRPVFVAPAQAGIAIESSIDVSAETGEFVVRFGLIEKGDAVQAERVLMLPHVACRELDPLLAFVLAAMLDPDAPLIPPRLPEGLSDSTRNLLADLFGNEPTVPPLELAAPSAKSAQPTPRIEKKPEPEITAQAILDSYTPYVHPRFTLFASGGAGAGILPSATPVGAVEARYRFYEQWVARASWSTWLEQSTAPTSKSKAAFSLWSGALLGCPAPLWDGVLPLRLCGGLALGRMATSASGVASPHDPSRFYSAGVLAADLSWSPGARIWLRAGASGMVSFIRDRFVLEGTSDNVEAHRASALAVQLDLGVGVALF